MACQREMEGAPQAPLLLGLAECETFLRPGRHRSETSSDREHMALNSTWSCLIEGATGLGPTFAQRSCIYNQARSSHALQHWQTLGILGELHRNQS